MAVATDRSIRRTDRRLARPPARFRMSSRARTRAHVCMSSSRARNVEITEQPYRKRGIVLRSGIVRERRINVGFRSDREKIRRFWKMYLAVANKLIDILNNSVLSLVSENYYSFILLLNTP